MSERFTRWDIAEELKTDEDIAGFLEAALEEDDPDFFAHALAVAARALRLRSSITSADAPADP